MPVDLILMAIAIVIALYALLLYVYNGLRNYKIKRSHYALEKIKFTDIKVQKIQELAKHFESSNKNAMINNIIKQEIGRNYDKDVRDDFIQVLEEIRVVCEGCLNGIFDQEYVKSNLHSTIEKYINNSMKYNIINNTEKYTAIELLLQEWKYKGNIALKKRGII